MAVELRVRFPVDDAELSALHHRAFHPDSPDADADVRPWASRLERHSVSWVGAFSAGRLVGFVHAVWDGGTHAFVLDTAVHADFQRQGTGQALVRAVTDEAFKAGCDWVHVDYEPHLSAFYERGCGFRAAPAGLRASHVQGRLPDTALDADPESGSPGET
jgi:ribosomal protein S18 acetylase RimI-like enzyme